MKITNDKYYTPIETANYIWDKVAEIIGFENISEIIEPSCGDGSFYHHPLYKPHFGYDIEPECNYPNIIKGDFLSQNISYLEGRLIIGNPPFGSCMSLAQKFYNKACNIVDYIAFILPISQLNNTKSLYKFDLIYSEDLGEVRFSDRALRVCFNIYKRPACWENKKKASKLKSITIYRQDCTGYEEKPFDIRMCYWGDGTCGKILKEYESYSGEYKILIKDDTHKEEIENFIREFNWNSYIKGIAMKRLKQYHIIDKIKEQFPFLQ